MNTEKDFAELKTAVRENEIVLNEGQQKAYDALVGLANCKDETYLFTGAAGTGKSTVLSLAVDHLASVCRVAILAPTKAAEDVVVRMLEDRKVDRMQGDPTKIDNVIESVEVSTIHSALGLAMVEQEDGTTKVEVVLASTLHLYDTVFIDECSMLDADLLHLVIDMRGPNTNIVFCGDKNQIPPVNPVQDATGTLDPDDSPEELSPVFDMFNLCPHLVFNLTETVRQKQGSPANLLSKYIISLNTLKPSVALRATHIRDLIKSLPNQQMELFLFRQGETRPPHLGYNSEVCPWYLENIVRYIVAAVNEGYDARTICYTNKTVQHINRWVHNIRFPGQFYAPGERVLMHLPHKRIMLFRTPNKDGNLVSYGAYKSQLFTVESCTPIGKGVLGLELLRLHLRTRLNELVITDVPVNMEEFIALKRAIWAKYTPLRKERAKAKAVRDSLSEGTKAYIEADERHQLLDRAAKVASMQAWAVTKEHCELRFTYAVTSHSSQGATFDCAVVHLADFTYYLKDNNAIVGGLTANKMNKMLYVGVTRPRSTLVIMHNDKLPPYQAPQCPQEEDDHD